MLHSKKTHTSQGRIAYHPSSGFQETKERGSVASERFDLVQLWVVICCAGRIDDSRQVVARLVLPSRYIDSNNVIGVIVHRSLKITDHIAKF